MLSKFDISKINPLIGNWSRKEWIFFFLVVPSVLCGIFLLPETIRQYLVLDPQQPSLLSIFANNYTHSNYSHLFENVGSYMVLIFVLFNIETDKSRFYRFVAATFFLLPFLASLFVVFFLPSMPPVQGFSAIGSAFMGYAMYAAYAYLKKRFEFVSVNLFYVFMFFNFALLVIINDLITSIKAVVLTVFAIFFITEIRTIEKLVHEFWKYLKVVRQEKIFFRVYRMCIFGVTSVIVLSLPVLIPAKIFENGSLTNTPAHYFGWVFGSFFPFTIVVLNILIRVLRNRGRGRGTI